MPGPVQIPYSDRVVKNLRIAYAGIARDPAWAPLRAAQIETGLFEVGLDLSALDPARTAAEIRQELDSTVAGCMVGAARCAMANVRMSGLGADIAVERVRGYLRRARANWDALDPNGRTAAAEMEQQLTRSARETAGRAGAVVAALDHPESATLPDGRPVPAGSRQEAFLLITNETGAGLRRRQATERAGALLESLPGAGAQARCQAAEIDCLLASEGIGYAQLLGTVGMTEEDARREVADRLRDAEVTYARELLDTLGDTMVTAERGAFMIATLLSRNGLGYEALSPGGRRSAEEMRADVERRTRDAPAGFARTMYAAIATCGAGARAQGAALGDYITAHGLTYACLDTGGTATDAAMRDAVQARVRHVMRAAGVYTEFGT